MPAVIEIEQVTGDALKEAVEFMYTDLCATLRYAAGVDTKPGCERKALVNAAQRLGIKDLNKRCSDILIMCIDWVFCFHFNTDFVIFC